MWWCQRCVVVVGKRKQLRKQQHCSGGNGETVIIKMYFLKLKIKFTNFFLGFNIKCKTISILKLS